MELEGLEKRRGEGGCQCFTVCPLLKKGKDSVGCCCVPVSRSNLRSVCRILQTTQRAGNGKPCPSRTEDLMDSGYVCLSLGSSSSCPHSVGLLTFLRR